MANFFWLSSFLWQLNFGQNGLFTGFHPHFFDDDRPASGNLLAPLFLTVFGGALCFTVTVKVYCWGSRAVSE